MRKPAAVASYLGKPLSYIDVNGPSWSFAYEAEVNKLSRLNRVQRTGGVEINIAYDDTPNQMRVTETSGQFSSTDNRKRVERRFDGLGREVEARRGGTGIADDAVEGRSLDGLGRVWRAYRAGYGAMSGDYDEFTYDALGRVTQVSHSGGGGVVTTNYELNTATVSDERGNAVKRVNDALGRLTEVWEDPTALNFKTAYLYDLAGNLKRVDQYGSGATVLNSRSFEYDSLNELRKASNPESGVTRYKYDLAGNMVEKRDGDATVTTVSYDALNRMAGKSYSGGGGVATPAGRWCYDGLKYDAASGACAGSVVAASKGLLSSTGNTVSKMVWEHDSAGRVAATKQYTPPGASEAQAKVVGYSYYADDTRAALVYPSGRAVATCVDALGRAVWVSGQKTKSDCEGGVVAGPGEGYVTGLEWEAWGGVKKQRWGNGWWEATTYNGRGQMTERKLGTVDGQSDVWRVGLEYGTSNNGNVAALTLGLPGNSSAAQMEFDYDKLNRVKLAIENKVDGALPAVCEANRSARCQQYGYDATGNRALLTQWQAQPGAGVAQSFNVATNRVAEAGWDYDSRGNVKQSPGAVAGTVNKWLYDAEGRLRWVCKGVLEATSCVEGAGQPGASEAKYGYSAEGWRVTRASGSVSAVMVYGAEGQMVAEYGGEAGTPGVGYLSADHLGSTRVVSGGAFGSGVVRERRDYMPFGDEVQFGVGDVRSGVTGYGADDVRVKFTGKERDAETSLDHSLYRYSSAAQGRWTSPDPLPGWPEDPQSWNRYAYVRNNPLLLTDPLGLSYEICGVDGKDCGVYSDKQYEQLRKDKSFIIAKGKIYSRTKDGKQGDMLGSVKYQGPDLEDRGQAVSSGLAARADASNQLIATVAVGSTAVGVSGGAFVGFTGLSSGGLTTLATGGEAVGVEGLTAEQVALVSRWGRSGLQPGDWVMNGGTGLLTYLMSGKWQPGLGNQFANFTSGQNFLVPKATLQNPGWAENGLGWIKNLLGQRFFNP